MLKPLWRTGRALPLRVAGLGELRFFLDNCVPDPVGHFLLSQGHEVIFQRDSISTDAEDKLVALAAVENNAILISSDKDYRAIASRFHISHRRLRTLSRIQFRCAETKHVERLKVGLSLIQFEWTLCQAANDKRMFIDVMDNLFRTIR
jgi:predicted nuclease of predicted toxin-antitoxin system